MGKPRKVTNSKLAEATIVAAAAKLLETVNDPRTSDLLDRLHHAAATLKAEAIETSPRKQKKLALRPGDYPA